MNRMRRTFLKMPIMKDVNMLEVLAKTKNSAENIIEETKYDMLMAKFGLEGIRQAQAHKNSLESTSRHDESAGHSQGASRPS